MLVEDERARFLHQAFKDPALIKGRTASGLAIHIYIMIYIYIFMYSHRTFKYFQIIFNGFLKILDLLDVLRPFLVGFWVCVDDLSTGFKRSAGFLPCRSRVLWPRPRTV